MNKMFIQTMKNEEESGHGDYMDLLIVLHYWFDVSYPSICVPRSNTIRKQHIFFTPKVSNTLKEGGGEQKTFSPHFVFLVVSRWVLSSLFS